MSSSYVNRDLCSRDVPQYGKPPKVLEIQNAYEALQKYLLLSIAICCETDEKLHMIYDNRYKRNSKFIKDRENVKAGKRTKVEQCTYNTLVQFPNTVTGPLIAILRNSCNSESRSRVANCCSIFWCCR
jgi:hypothetical protein